MKDQPNFVETSPGRLTMPTFAERFIWKIAEEKRVRRERLARWHEEMKASAGDKAAMQCLEELAADGAV